MKGQKKYIPKESKHNFLGIKSRCNFEDSNVIIQQIPYEHSSSYGIGSKFAPRAIIDASYYVEYFDEELKKTTYLENGICTLKPINLKGKKDKQAIKYIEKCITNILGYNKFIVSIGGEHTISYGIYRAMAKKYENLSVLQIDAHADLRNSYQGNKYSHASVMSRINKTKPQIAQIGVRAFSRKEFKLMNKSINILPVFSSEVQDKALNFQEVNNHLTENVYLTIDADGLDLSIAPAVGTPEPGGLGWWQLCNFLKEVCQVKTIVGFDVVECSPIRKNTITEYNLAKLIYRIIGYCKIKK